MTTKGHFFLMIWNNSCSVHSV